MSAENVTVFNNGEGQTIALHEAANENNFAELQSLCNMSATDTDFIWQKDLYGRTALHYSRKKEGAQLIIESVNANGLDVRNFLLDTDTDKRTALHLASREGRTDVVEYLCSMPMISRDLILQKDESGRTALHSAKDSIIAKLLVESLSPPDQTLLLYSTVNIHNYTALHDAVHSNRIDVVKYLCSLACCTPGLILAKNIYGYTALHTARSKAMAQILLESVLFSDRIELIDAVDKDGDSALHVAAYTARVDVVKYLCQLNISIGSKPLSRNTNGRTPLHVASTLEVAELILSSISEEDRLRTLQVEDVEGNNVLLSLVKFGRAESLLHILEYLDELYFQKPTDYKLLLEKRNYFRQNVFHLAALSLDLESIHEVLQDYFSYIDFESMMNTDSYGNTPIHYIAAKYSTAVFADFILRLPLAKRRHFAKLKNRRQIDCRAIATVGQFTENFYLHAVLCEEEAVMLTFSQKFREQRNFPFPDVSFHLQYPQHFYQYDDTILKVLSYSLNEYRLQDIILAVPSRSCQQATAVDLARIELRLALGTTQRPETVEIDESTSDSLCVFIDIDHVSEPRLYVQGVLNSMDKPTYHGKPKVAVIQYSTAADILNLVVPGPDYLILMVQYFTSGYHTEKRPTAEICKNGKLLVDWYRKSSLVQRVRVNSTLGKQFWHDEIKCEGYGLDASAADTEGSSIDIHVAPSDSDSELTDIQSDINVFMPEAYGETRLASAEIELDREDTEEVQFSVIGRGKALVICNQTQTRGKELQIVKKVFESQLRLQTEVICDLTAKDMIRTVSEFAQSDGHGTLIVLSIISHGTAGNILDHQCADQCSLQTIINCLCCENTVSIAKLLLLSFCRGTIPPQFNRAPLSFESSMKFPWPENEVAVMLQPIRRQLSSETKYREWRRNDFCSLDLPIDCYVCFSTLPDSKSKPGILFKVLTKHLTEMSHLPSSTRIDTFRNQDRRNSASTDECSNDRIKDMFTHDSNPLSKVDSVAPPTDTTAQVPVTASTATTCQPVSRVEIVKLLTDVAGIVKEKSRSTQYINACYTLNKDSNSNYENPQWLTFIADHRKIYGMMATKILAEGPLLLLLGRLTYCAYLIHIPRQVVYYTNLQLAEDVILSSLRCLSSA